MAIDGYIEKASKLSAAERLELVQKLWDSIASDESKVPVTPAQKTELDRRLSAIQADEETGKRADGLGDDWQAVRRRIERE